MTPAEASEIYYSRADLVDDGLWVLRCVGHFLAEGMWQGRLVTLWELLAKLDALGEVVWRRSDPSEIREGYSDPNQAIVPRFYKAKAKGPRAMVAPHSDAVGDFFRLKSIRPRFDRFPVEAFDGEIVLAELVTIDKNRDGDTCPPYTKVQRIIRAATLPCP